MKAYEAHMNVHVCVDVCYRVRVPTAGNNIGAAGATAIASALVSVREMTSLDLTCGWHTVIFAV